MKTKKQQDWQRFTAQNQRVTFSLTKQEYKFLANHAETQGRTPGQQVWLESLAYRQQRYLPSQVIAQKIHDLQITLRQLHNDLQQIDGLNDPDFLAKLKQADYRLQRFVQPTHDPQKP